MTATVKPPRPAPAREAAQAPPPEKKAGKKRRLVLIVGILVILGIVVIGAKKFLLKSHKPKKAVAGAVVSLPETTINLSDGHLLQVTLAVQTQKGLVKKGKSLPSSDLARMENDEITLLSQFSYKELLAASGKAQAKSELLSHFRQVVGPGKVGPGVMAVYYTDFVMQ